MSETLLRIITFVLVGAAGAGLVIALVGLWALLASLWSLTKWGRR